MRDSVLVVDFGTSNVRVNLIDLEKGEVLFGVSRKYLWNFTEGAYAQMEARTMWEKSEQCVSEAILAAKTGEIEIQALTFAFFGDNTLLCDENYEPVYPIILSFDSRGKEEIEELLRVCGLRETIGSIGSVPDGTSVPAKYLWFKKNTDILKKSRYLCTNQQYVLHKLGLPPVNDRTMAFRKSLLNVNTAAWDTVLMKYLEIEKDTLGEVVSSSENLGKIERYGTVKLPRKIPVFPGAHDCNIGFLGLGLHENRKGIVGNISGTYDHFGYFVQEGGIEEEIKNQKRNELLTGYACIDNCRIILGARPAFGSCLDWFMKEIVGKDTQKSYQELWRKSSFEEPERIAVGCDFSENNGSIKNLNFSTTKEEIFQALIETLTMESRRLFERCTKLKKETIQKIRIGGGTAREDKWNQLRADIFGIPIVCMQNFESSSIGAGVLAAHAIGRYSSIEEAIENMIYEEKIFYPREVCRKMFEEKYQS